MPCTVLLLCYLPVHKWHTLRIPSQIVQLTLTKLIGDEERQRVLCIQKRAAVSGTHRHAGKCRIKMPLLSWNGGAQQCRGDRKIEKKERLLNSFIIQMNENHINASRRGRASVSKLAHQLCEETNEVQGLSVAVAHSPQKGF